MKNSHYKKKIGIFIGVVVLVAVAALLFRPFNKEGESKNEWIMVQEDAAKDSMKVKITDADELIVSYDDPDLKVQQNLYYAIKEPESADDPYTTSEIVKYEVIIPASSEENMDRSIADYTELGFLVEEQDGNTAISTEDAALMSEEVGLLTNTYHFYKIEDTLELVYLNEFKEELYLAIPSENNERYAEPAYQEYIQMIEALDSYLDPFDMERIKWADEEIDQIESLQPKSKLLSIYKELTGLAEAYQQAFNETDADELAKILEQIAAIPLANIHGLYDEYQAHADAYIASFQQAEVSLEDFHGYWATLNDVSYSEIGTYVFYLSDEFQVSAIVMSEFAASHIEDYTLEGNTLTLSLQPTHGMSPEDYEPHTMQLTLEKEPEGKTLTSSANPEVMFYPMTDEEYLAHSETNLALKAQEFYDQYLMQGTQTTEMAADPVGFLLGRSIVEHEGNIRRTYTFQPKNEAGIGEMNYRRVTLDDNGDEMDSGWVQFTVYDLTFEAGVFTITYAEGPATTPMDVMQFAYVDEETIAMLDPATGEIMGYQTLTSPSNG